MSDFFSRVGEFVGALLGGGTLEIVLLIVIIVVAVILFLVALFILWKLLVLLGKGLLWLFRTGGGAAKQQSAARREARLAAPPAVATGWGSSPRIRLRAALAQGRRLAGPDALTIVVLAGDGVSDLCRSLGITPPAVAGIGVAAGSEVVLVDATRADGRRLRGLASALPWRRPVDGVAALVDARGIPNETLARSATFARAAGLRVALHLVLGPKSTTGSYRIVDASNRDGADLTTQLAQDAARVWLAGGLREGLEDLSAAQSAELSTALDRAIVAAPASTVDVASLSLGGAGLRGAAAQAAARTRPADAPGLAMWFGLGGLALGLALTALVAVVGLDGASDLRDSVRTAAREAQTPWLASGVEAVPSGARVRRIAGVSARLATFSETSVLAPLAATIPNYNAPSELGRALLTAYVLRPMAAALDRQARVRLAPGDDPARWLEEAQLVGEWLAAWEGLQSAPEEVDLRRLLSDAFGGEPASWPEGLDLALVATDAVPPAVEQGGLDVDALTDLAHSNFIATMQRWAESVYTNGPVALAARRAIDRSAAWQDQHQALSDLRMALQDPGQVWLTAAEDRPDHAFELRMLGRALAISIIGQTSTLEAKAGVSRIRIDARQAAEYFIIPEVGPLMVRSGSGSQGGGGGPSLSLSEPGKAWLAFLDRLRGAGFADLPTTSGNVVAGSVTLDAPSVSQVVEKLRTFDRLAAEPPINLPPAVASELFQAVGNELVGGVAAGVELALRPAAVTGLYAVEADRISRVQPALAQLAEIEEWLRGRRAFDAADRVRNVAARVAEGILAAGAEALALEDPLGIVLDPAADANAVVRRFERGVVRLQRLYEQYAEPYLAPALLGGREFAFRWQDIGEDLDGFERGDAQVALSGLEGMLQAYAEDADAACDAPRPMAASGRDDYVAEALLRVRGQVNRACTELRARRAAALHADLSTYFRGKVAWMWPYSSDPVAPELPGSTLGEFVGRLHDAGDDLGRMRGSYAQIFNTSAAFWDRLEDGSAALRLIVDWRARPVEERLAEHLLELVFDGVQKDDAGIHTWRYGTPVALRMRLAKNSPYRFAASTDADGLVRVIDGGGNGSLLRILEGVSSGAFEVEAELLDDAGESHRLVVTARIGDENGAPLSVPDFHTFPASGAGRGVNGGSGGD